MTLPRFLLLVVMLAAAIPWLSVELLRTTSPGATGRFHETADPSRYFLNHTDFRYRAPAEIGTARRLTVEPLLRFGAPGERRYYSLGATAGAPRPALVLLHGAGRDGRSMLDMWQALARQEDLVLIAPDAARPQGWSLWHDGALFAGALLEDVARHHPIDPDQVYLIGHSMGGKFALRLANLGLGPWRAVAVHAGQIPAGTVLPARRPIPIFLDVGETDPTFTPDSVRRSAQRLSAAGHDVKMTVIPDHGHWYYRIAPQIAPRIWSELQTPAPQRLTAARAD